MKSDRDALMLEAQDLRLRQRIPAALATLARLQAMHPRFSRLYQEQGHCHILLGDGPAAIAALSKAVQLNATLPASWDMLEQLYRRAGDGPRARAAAQHLATLRQLPKEVVVANSLYADGELASAAEIIADYVHRHAGNVGALRLLARIRMEQAALKEAESLLARVVELAPDYHAARLDYAMVLLQRQKPVEARKEAQTLLGHDPDNRDYLKQYGAACIALGDYEPVIDLYDKLLSNASGPEAEDLRLWRANALKVTGRATEAIADYHAALAERPDNGVAWFSLANLKTYRFGDDDIARMQAATDRPDLQAMDCIYLSFALGKAFEDRGNYAQSWQYYTSGNAGRRAMSRWRPDVADACALRTRQVFTSEFFRTRQGWGVADADPVFIVGLPRSGSTLIEQILATHSQIEGTQELTEIGRYAAESCGRDPDCALPLSPEALLDLTPEFTRALAKRFLDETRVHRRLGRPYFIDKMPNNFWHVGLIQLLLPNATIIDVRREPMACCFSNLKQLFGTHNQEFTYGIDDIARYYRTYLDLMRHWDRVLPGRVLRVGYEALVDDLDGGVRRILAHCRLPFELACLTFHETRRSVRTPSSEQVRQPINREGLTQWQHYAPWLETLREALGNALMTYKD